MPRARRLRTIERMHTWRHGEYSISTDKSLLQIDVVHGFLTSSYWAAGIPRETVERSIEGSLCYGAYRGERQVGFARVITDRATFAYIGDVFVIEEERGRGLSKVLMQAITSTPELQGLRRWMLVTRDAHELYSKFDFKPLAHPECIMERRDPDVYTRT